MFEIMKALAAMKEAAGENDNHFEFTVNDHSVLVVEVALHDHDVEFLATMRALLGPA